MTVLGTATRTTVPEAPRPGADDRTRRQFVDNRAPADRAFRGLTRGARSWCSSSSPSSASSWPCGRPRAPGVEVLVPHHPGLAARHPPLRNRRDHGGHRSGPDGGPWPAPGRKTAIEDSTESDYLSCLSSNGGRDGLAALSNGCINVKPAEVDRFRRLTAQIVVAHVAHNKLDVAEVPSLIEIVHKTLVGLGKAPEEPVRQEPVSRSGNLYSQITLSAWKTARS